MFESDDRRPWRGSNRYSVDLFMSGVISSLVPEGMVMTPVRAQVEAGAVDVSALAWARNHFCYGGATDAPGAPSSPSCKEHTGTVGA